MAELQPFTGMHDGTRLELMAAHPAGAGRRPAVIVFPDFSGRDRNAIQFAERVTQWGYVGIAADTFGEGKVGASREEKSALMQPFLENRAFLQERLTALVESAKGVPAVDPARVAAIGFCFGGLCVLDLARIGAGVCAVAAFHGLFTPPGNTEGREIRAKVIAFHGWDDPMVKPDQVEALGRELTAARADWQLHAFGGTMHAFMTPGANDPGFGTVYNEKTARRAWSMLGQFLEEAFA